MGISGQAKGHSTTCRNPTEPPQALLATAPLVAGGRPRFLDTRPESAGMIGKMDKLLPKAALPTSSGIIGQPDKHRRERRRNRCWVMIPSRRVTKCIPPPAAPPPAPPYNHQQFSVSVGMCEHKDSM